MVVTVLPQLPPHVTASAYNGDGDRISQTADGVTTGYVVNSVPTLAQVLMETTAGQTTYYVYGHDLLYSVKADGPHYHHADSLGSTIAVTDSTGAVEQTMDYDVFGVLRSITGSSGTTYTFTGEENDSSGLTYLRARYYDPASGRFLSRDPYPMDAEDTQTINRYVYVKNNPINYVDPSGEVPWGTVLRFVCGDICLVPLKVQQVIEIRRDMRSRFPGDGIRDAYRHAETSRRITVEVDPLFGFVTGYFHEASNALKGQQTLGDFTMDVYNNTVGLVQGIRGEPVDLDFLRVLAQDRKHLEYIRSQQQ
jgi:RHS repeat-associated protein